MLILSDGSRLPYDRLVLTPGLECADLMKEISNPPEKPISKPESKGIFVLNTEESVSNFENKFLALYRKADNPLPVVVWTKSLHLDGFCVVSGLMERGVKPSNILWLCSSEQTSEWCGDHEEIHMRFMNACEKAGVTVIFQVNINSMNIDSKVLGSVEFEIDTFEGEEDEGGFAGELVELDEETGKYTCRPAAFVCCGRDSPGKNIIDIVSDLAFDDRLIVDGAFIAEDNCWAGGPFTKFSRRYGETNPIGSFSSIEIGKCIASSVLESFEEHNFSDMPLPVFKKPKTVLGRMPGGTIYFSSSSVSPSSGQTRDISTEVGGNFCSLTLSGFGIIERIVCLGSDALNCADFEQLIGTNEKYLGNLVGKFDKQEIKDLASHMQSPHQAPLYHEFFENFRESLVQVLMGSGCAEEIMNEVSQHVNNNGEHID
eukprot:898071_1